MFPNVLNNVNQGIINVKYYLSLCDVRILCYKLDIFISKQHKINEVFIFPAYE